VREPGPYQETGERWRYQGQLAGPLEVRESGVAVGAVGCDRCGRRRRRRRRHITSRRVWVEESVG
jgi:hypothetical protein